MAKIEFKKYYSLKSLKESIIVVLLCTILIMLTLKFGESPISFLLKSMGLNILIILIGIFLLSYLITYSINYAYSQMDIKSKDNNKKDNN